MLLCSTQDVLCKSSFDNGKKKKTTFCQGVQNFFRNVADIHKDMFSRDSLKVLVAAAPFYAQARKLDPHLHECFYNCDNHTNICQLFKDDFCEKLDYIASIPPLIFASGLVFSKNERIKTAAKIYLTGLPFVLITKKILKKIIKKDICLRPRNGCFDKCKVHYGGFPSGTMATTTYTLVVAGLQVGRMAAIPIGLFAGAITVVYINCNRHYYSQIVAGAVLGALYGIAASKVVDLEMEKKDREKRVSFGFDVTTKGDPAFSLCYRF